jgi:succinate dehydrogenase / fumarate reductase, cytochrome b subunit
VEAAIQSPSATTSSSFLVRNEFLIRRLHSLSGLVPVGAYMCVHLITNASILGGGWFFQEQVDRIHSLGPALPFVEWAFIFIPLLFHAIFGVVIIKGGLSNTGNYPFTNNYRYTLQRVTGMIAFVYIMVHVFHMHHLGAWLGSGWAVFNPKDAAGSAAAALSSTWTQIFYAIGVLACVYHLANGLWTMGITWGVWVSPKAQSRANYFCAAFGVGLALVGLSALWGMSRAGGTPATVTAPKVDPNAPVSKGSPAPMDTMPGNKGAPKKGAEKMPETKAPETKSPEKAPEAPTK